MTKFHPQQSIHTDLSWLQKSPLQWSPSTQRAVIININTEANIRAVCPVQQKTLPCCREYLSPRGHCERSLPGSMFHSLSPTSTLCCRCLPIPMMPPESCVTSTFTHAASVSTVTPNEKEKKEGALYGESFNSVYLLARAQQRNLQSWNSLLALF